MAESLTPTVKAGRLIRLLGWINLIITLFIGLIILGDHARNQPVQISYWVFFVGGFFVSIAMLVIGAMVKQNKIWAKVLGGIFAVLSMAGFPIGTVAGAVTLFYLVKGWNDDA